jgi:hypothetical protein
MNAMERDNVPSCCVLCNGPKATMPRFYFPTWEGDHFVPDDEGVEFDSLETARVVAARGLAEIARDSFSVSGGACSLRMSVLEEGGESVLELSLTLEILQGSRELTPDH